jgi:phytoene dehydrogenase-like protein
VLVGRPGNPAEDAVPPPTRARRSSFGSMTGRPAPVREFDVVVLGAGLSGGLPAACYLQKAGLDVLLVEAEAACGTSYRSYEVAGVKFDHSPVNFSGLSPVVDDLELDRYGYRIRRPRVLYAARSAGREAIFLPDLGATRASLARFSPEDAATAVELMAALGEAAPALLDCAFFTPNPDLERAVELTAAAAGLRPAELASLTGPDLVERLFPSDAVRVLMTALPALNLLGDLLEPGQGALAWLWTFLLRAYEAPAGNGALVDALERCFGDHGGTLLLETAARELLVDGGAVVGATLEGTRGVEKVRARRAVVSNLGPVVTAELLGGAAGPVARPWRTAGRTVATADLVLHRPLALAGATAESLRIYLLWPDWDTCRRWLEDARRECAETFFGHLELTQLHVLYGPRAGAFGLRIRFGTGPWIDDDWEARRQLLADAALERLAEVDSGIRAAIAELRVSTPADHWGANGAARHGNPVGGDVVAGQWLGERLPYRTGVEGLYASNGVWPPALSWMAAGYNAACAVAEDAGVRDRTWWNAQPAARPPRALSSP